MGSAREAAEERSQLRGDTKNGTFDDADDGSDEAADEGNGRHESTSLSGATELEKSSSRGRYSNLQQQGQASKQLPEFDTKSMMTRKMVLLWCLASRKEVL